MPRRNGAPNYRTDLLIGIVESLKPKGAEGWKRVAVLYQQDSGEAMLRDGDDIKRHWIEKLCYKFKKPTGKTGQIESDRIFRCQTIQREIQATQDCKGNSGKFDEHSVGNARPSINPMTPFAEGSLEAINSLNSAILLLWAIAQMPRYFYARKPRRQ